MESYLCRYNTFHNWPETAPVRPLELVPKGYYFTDYCSGTASYQQQQQSKHVAVTCFACSESFVHFTSLEVLIKEHQRRSPRCRSSSLNAQYEPQVSHRSALMGDSASPFGAAVDRVVEQLARILECRLTLDDRAGRVSRADQLRSATFRWTTFEKWPKKEIINPFLLAQSGFYYEESSSDTVSCVYCGVSLRNWVEGDQPDQVHRDANPRCPFVRMKFRQLLPATVGHTVIANPQFRPT
jgi:hypothetical protein